MCRQYSYLNFSFLTLVDRAETMHREYVSDSWVDSVFRVLVVPIPVIQQFSNSIPVAPPICFHSFVSFVYIQISTISISTIQIYRDSISSFSEHRMKSW